ncbi:MAG: hypothetical protein ABJF23_21175 [Bryobacteraceae bacterium]
MLYYPQLSTGTLAQYPLRKTLLKRTIVNDCLDSRSVKLADVFAAQVAWQLDYAGVTQAEWDQLKWLFLAAEGRLETFVFLDPTDNLLRFSENLSSTVWQKDGLLQLSGSVADPMGTTRATRLVNAALVNQSIAQTIEAPGWFSYCFSVFVRAATPGPVTLTRRSADGADSRTEIVGPAWRRLQSSGSIDGTAPQVAFEMAVPTGAIVDVFGFQAEAQPLPSAYKKTASQSGVYPSTRFREDTITPVAAGPNDYAVQIQLISKAGS